MALLVFGRSGQVARALADLAPDAVFLGREEADLSDPEACAAAIRRLAPEAVINAAAHTAVDQAESEETLALRINGESPGRMAESCAALGIPFVTISTDYVFDGAGEAPFRPDHPTAPLNAYGRSKAAGEAAVMAAGGPCVVLRTSWVFSAEGRNFLTTMLRLSQTRDRLGIVADQVGGPTTADAIAAACLRIVAALKADPGTRGIYHFTGAPDVSWAEFAEAIFAAAGRSVTVDALTTEDYPTPARRPRNSRLDCSATERAFGIGRPDWRAATARMVASLTEPEAPQ